MSGSLRAGFAWDDTFIVEANPVVQGGEVGEAVRHPWWPDAFTFAGSGLYRPTTSAALTLQWRWFDGHPRGFHAVALVLHAGVVLAVFGLARLWVPPLAAFGGAALFAVHPVHVEAVANVVGQAELLAALLVLGALLVWARWHRTRNAGARIGWSMAFAGLSLAAFGAKEIAITLPALAVLTAVGRGERLRKGLPLLAIAGAAAVAYLALRLDVVGTLRGEVPAPELVGLSTPARVFTGLSMWVDHVRLLVAPLALSADYGPSVRFPAQAFDPLVFVGASLPLALLGLALAMRRTPVIAVGLVWIVVSILPVSNLVVPAGVLLAERTLYLPSVGLALVVAGLLTRMSSPTRRRTWTTGLVALVVAFAVRSALRVPVWESSDTVLASLARDHPDSHIVLRAGAVRAMSEGRTEEARERFARALSLVPRHFSLLTEVAQFEAVTGRAEDAVAYARRAIALYPTSPHGYAVLARVLRLSGDPEGARAEAIEGLRVADPLAPLWREIEEVRRVPH